MEIGEAGPLLKKLKVGMLEPELQLEVARIAAELGFEETVTSSSSLHFLYRLYRAEEAKERRSRKALKKAEDLILRLSSLHHAVVQDRLERSGRERSTRSFRTLHLIEENTVRTRHETEQAQGHLRKILAQSLGTWMDVERHFAKRPMVEAIESLVRASNPDTEFMGRLVDEYFKLPSGISEEDMRRKIDLWLVSERMGAISPWVLPAQIQTAYDLIRQSKVHEQKLEAYLLIRRSGEGLASVDLTMLDGVRLAGMNPSRSCMLMSLAIERPEWIKSVKRLLDVPWDRAQEIVDDIVRYCREEKQSALQSAKTLGGKSTVVRLDFGDEGVLFFRFGDARSHALGYELLRRYGFPVPQSSELHPSMCNLERKEDGVAYGDAHGISRKAAHSLGRLLAACFIFGIPDPNETNFLIRRDEAVKIDAESAPNGWNEYSGTFIGGADRSKPNDSYGFVRLLRLHPDISKDISRGFVEGIHSLRQSFDNKGEIDALCHFVREEYSGAHMYRASVGLDEDTIERLRKRLKALLIYTPEDLYEKARRGLQVR